MNTTNTTSSRHWSQLDNPPDFSLVLGGPLFQLLRRAHLSDDALQMVRQRIVVISLFTWLPLFLLAAFEGQLLDSGSDLVFPRRTLVSMHYLH